MTRLCAFRIPVSILYKSIAGRYRPVRVADGLITARYRFIKNASLDVIETTKSKLFPKETNCMKCQTHYFMGVGEGEGEEEGSLGGE